jgi:hypothetical protein
MFMRNRVLRGILAATLLVAGGAALAQAASPYLHIKQKMNYQGLLTSSGTPYTGTRSLVFRIYDQSSGGSMLWTETQGSVAVSNGIFNVVLGSVNPITITFRKEYWLEIQVETETLAPRHLLTNASYAMASRKVVYQQVITVAHDGGDTNTVYGALQLIAQESPTPSSTDQWLIEVQAGTFNEVNSLSFPDGVSIRGQGYAATTVSLPNNGTVSMGSNCGMEALTLSLQGSSSNLSLSSATGSHIRDCYLLTNQSNPFIISMLSTVNCEFINNRVLAQTSGNYILYMQSAQDAHIENNYFEFMQITNGTGIYAANTTHCTILKNTLKFEGATDASRGISINNNYSSTRVSYNVFIGEATTPAGNDIYTPLGYPVRPTHTGPYGICNHGSSGAELPAF